VAVLIGCAVFLIGGYLFKAQCIGAFNENAYERACYNDLQPLYGIRLFRTGTPEKVPPYIRGDFIDSDGDGSRDQLVDGAIEYPVLTGVFMWASGSLVDNADDYLKVSALLLFPFGFLIAYLLARMAGMRALLWAVAPAIVLYAFHNWDLLVVAAAVGGLFLWSRGKPVGAAVLFGIGAALKMYPIFFLGPLFFQLLHERDVKRAFGSAAAGFGTVIAINLPFALANPDGWFATYAFHRERRPNFDSIWQLGWPQWTPDQLNLVTAVLTGAFFVGVLAYGSWRARREGIYPFLAVCGALLASFLLWNKVHSPQYTLWLLPFFVLIRVHIAWWVAYALADAAAYVGVFRWFYDLGQGEDFTTAKKLMIGGVWGRATLLMALVVVFLASRRREPMGDGGEGAGDRSPLEPSEPRLAVSAGL
jgi:uncharacterized membrane protein